MMKVASKLYFPATPELVLEYRNLDPDAFLESIDIDIAQKIINEWRAMRGQESTPSAVEKTIAAYHVNHVRLCHNYAKELNIEVDMIDPVQVVHKFFSHAKKISAASWTMYRYSLRHVFSEQADILQKKGLPHAKLQRALAALITFSKKPHEDDRDEDYAGKQVRIKSIGRVHFEQLIDELANGKEAKSIRNQRTQSFALATIATGLRPGEWMDTEIRDATPQDFVDGTNPEGWVALVINTSKRKQNEVPWVRTILIEPGHYQVHIRQHMRMVNKFMERSSGVDPFEVQYIQKCSSTLRDTARKLWPLDPKRPKNPERWITLYSLRSQARANLVSVHGAFIGAAMLGHSPEKSARYYAGSHRANLPKGGGIASMPRPGVDCLLKASEFAMRMEIVESMAPESAPAEVPAA